MTKDAAAQPIEDRMEVFALAERCSPKVLFQRQIGGLIEQIGCPTFSSALFQFANSWIGVDHLTAFSFGANRDARMVFAENKGRAPVARTVAAKYVSEYWHFDPADLRRRPAERASCDNVRWAVRTSASDIANLSYRARCYSSVNLNDRLSLSATQGDRVVRLSFYRRSGNNFSEDDTARILESSDVLISLVLRHSEQVWADTGAGAGDRFHDRLRAVAPTLSRREREVCALIAQGMTSEGIRLTLNIALSTVHTYRKRAYARLNISSQSELIRLIMN